MNKNFGLKKELKLNDFYNTLTGDLGVDLNIKDIKSLNKYLQNKQADNSDIELLEKDQNKIDLVFLKQILQQDESKKSN